MLTHAVPCEPGRKAADGFLTVKQLAAGNARAVLAAARSYVNA